MNKEDQNKYVLDALDVRFHEVKAQWAKNWIAKRINENICLRETNDEKKRATAKAQVEACIKNMEIAEQEIANFEWLLDEAKK